MTTLRAHKLNLLAAACCTALALSACGASETEASGEAPDCEFSPDLIAAAQEEGEVHLYTGGHVESLSNALNEEFESAYGITLTTVLGSSGDATRMINAELASGNVNADVVGLADPAAMADLDSQGALAAIEVPNVTQIEPGVNDPSTPQLPFTTVPMGVMYNSASDTVAPDTWEELVDFDGRIAIADPNTSGAAMIYFSQLMDELGDDWMTELAESDYMVTESTKTLAQLILTGEADLALPAVEPEASAAADAGEPLELAYPMPVVPSFNSEIAVLDAAPNPNAAELLVGYHLCHAGYQTVLGEHGTRSVLSDPPPADGFHDLTGHEMISPELEVLNEQGPQTRSRFADLFR